MTANNARTGVVGLGTGVTLGGPLGVILNHVFSVSPLHWYLPSNETMVSAVTGFSMTFMGIVGLVINYYIGPHEAKK